MSIGDVLGAQCIRTVRMETSKFFALECPGYLGIGGKIWDSTYVLLRYLSRPDISCLLAARSVLELGSGTGIAGIAIARLNPSSVTLTDLPDIVPLLRYAIY